MQKGQGEKSCEIQGGGQEMAASCVKSVAKNLIMTIQVNWCQFWNEATQIDLNCCYQIFFH